MATQLLPSATEPAVDANARERFAWYAETARWAPSKHNSQPWQFVVRGPSLEFWMDSLRVLPATDPKGRELVISVGAAVHLACVAARAHGFAPTVAIQPDGPDGCLARLTEIGPWLPTREDRAALDAVPRRRTDRGPLDKATLPDTLPFQLQSIARGAGTDLRLIATHGDRATLARLVERADRLLVLAGGIDTEIAEWQREPDDPRPDGVPTDHTRGAAASYRSEFVQRDFSSNASKPAQDRPGRDDPIIAILCTPADRVADWLAAGRALAAMLLHATTAGANASYLNQPVELPSMRAQLGEHLDLPGLAQLILRIGVGADVTPTPRRAPEDLTRFA